MKTKKTTIKELTESLGEGYDYLMVSALIKFLVTLGVVKDVGSAPQPVGQRGKPSRVYEIPQVAELQFFMDDESSSVSTETVLPETEKIVDNRENKEQNSVVEKVS